MVEGFAGRPLGPIVGGKIFALQATIALLLTLLMKAKIRITAFQFWVPFFCSCRPWRFLRPAAAWPLWQLVRLLMPCSNAKRRRFDQRPEQTEPGCLHPSP